MQIKPPAYPEPIVALRSSFDPCDAEASSMARMARLAALFKRRQWIEDHVGLELDATLAWIHLNAPALPLNSAETVSPSEPEGLFSYADLVSIIETIRKQAPPANAKNIDAETAPPINFMEKFLDIYRDTTRQSTPSIENAPRDARHLIRAVIPASGRDISKASLDTVQAFLATSKNNAQEFASTEPPAPLSPQADLNSLEIIKKALALNTLQIRQTIRWEWEDVPHIRHKRIDAENFLKLLVLGEQRLAILKWDETKLEHIRENRRAWFANKMQIQLHMIDSVGEKEPCFLNQLSLEKTLWLYELQKLARRTLLISLCWPLTDEARATWAEHSQNLMKLMNQILKSRVLQPA